MLRTDNGEAQISWQFRETAAIVPPHQLDEIPSFTLAKVSKHTCAFECARIKRLMNQFKKLLQFNTVRLTTRDDYNLNKCQTRKRMHCTHKNRSKPSSGCQQTVKLAKNVLDWSVQLFCYLQVLLLIICLTKLPKLQAQLQHILFLKRLAKQLAQMAPSSDTPITEAQMQQALKV